MELSDPEDDPTATMIILGILYDSDVQVPTNVDLQTFHNIATLVDKFQWHATVTPFSIAWFDHLEDTQGFPNAFDDTLLSWLWIAWVFEIKDRFKKLSYIAQQYANEPIDISDKKILLPPRVLQGINDQRTAGLQLIKQKVATFREDLLKQVGRENDPSSNNMLMCMVLGHATVVARNLELGEFAAPDYAGISLRILQDRIKSIESTSGFLVKSPYGHSQYFRRGSPWDLKSILEEAIKGFNADSWGVEYDDIKS